MGNVYNPVWQVDRNDVQGIPEGAAFCAEFHHRRIRFEVESGSARASIRVIESKLKRKVTKPVFYWKTGKSIRHEMPELAVVKFKIHPLVKCELCLTGPFVVIEFHRRKSPKKGRDVVVATTGPGDEGTFCAILFRRGFKSFRARVWCLDDPKLDFIEKEAKKGKTWKVIEENPLCLVEADACTCGFMEV